MIGIVKGDEQRIEHMSHYNNYGEHSIENRMGTCLLLEHF